MDNPNAYNEAGFQRWDVEVNDSVVELWEAGASTEDIENAVASALENAIEGAKVNVSIVVRT